MQTNPLISDRFGCKYGAIVAPIVASKHGTNVLLGTKFWGTNIALYPAILSPIGMYFCDSF
jgi:hypothetical protein